MCVYECIIYVPLCTDLQNDHGVLYRREIFTVKIKMLTETIFNSEKRSHDYTPWVVNFQFLRYFLQ